MAEVFAGFVSGYILALVFTALAAVMIVGARSRIPYLAKAIAPNISAAALTVPISLIAFLIWTAIGMVLGLLYRGAEDQAPGGGLGSPNLLYTLVIALTGAFILTLVAALWRRLPWQVAVMALTSVAVFGWAMPYLAQAAK
jgi:glucan phosphoethanolaminetransferase (alkaline phosphatase superfamily)